MRLYLARHAQTEWNVAGKAQGFADISLDEKGRAQAMRLAERFRSIDLKYVYSSDLRRCVQTASPIAEVTGAELIFEPALRERNMGGWEGQSFDRLRQMFRDISEPDDVYSLSARPPDGESIHDVWARLKPVVQSIAAGSEPTLVVSHGGASTLILAQLLHADVITARSFRFGNAALTELIKNDWGLFHLERYNCDSHLSELQSLVGNLDGSTR